MAATHKTCTTEPPASAAGSLEPAQANSLLQRPAASSSLGGKEPARLRRCWFDCMESCLGLTLNVHLTVERVTQQLRSTVSTAQNAQRSGAAATTDIMEGASERGRSRGGPGGHEGSRGGLLRASCGKSQCGGWARQPRWGWGRRERAGGQTEAGKERERGQKECVGSSIPLCRQLETDGSAPAAASWRASHAETAGRARTVEAGSRPGTAHSLVSPAARGQLSAAPGCGSAPGRRPLARSATAGAQEPPSREPPGLPRSATCAAGQTRHSCEQGVRAGVRQ